MAFKSGSPMSPIDHDYGRVSREHGLRTIRSLRDLSDAMLAWRAAVGVVDCRQLLDLFATRSIGYNLRNPEMFSTDTEVWGPRRRSLTFRGRDLLNKITQSENLPQLEGQKTDMTIRRKAIPVVRSTASKHTEKFY